MSLLALACSPLSSKRFFGVTLRIQSSSTAHWSPRQCDNKQFTGGHGPASNVRIVLRSLTTFTYGLLFDVRTFLFRALLLTHSHTGTDEENFHSIFPLALTQSIFPIDGFFRMIFQISTSLLNWLRLLLQLDDWKPFQRLTKTPSSQVCVPRRKSKNVAFVLAFD